MPRSGHETALNDRVVRAGPTSEGREHGEGHSTVAKYLWLEMLSQHTVGAKGAALERGAGTGRQLYIAQLAEAMPVGREGGKRAGEARRNAPRAQRRDEEQTHDAPERSGCAMRISERIGNGEDR